jgi:hypothetical protein
MSTKFIRFVAVLAILVSVVGNTGVARADGGAPPIDSAQNLQPLDLPALNSPAASSLGVQFVHVVTAANILGSETIIDHPLTNGNPNAIILVTPNYSPGGSCGCVFDDHPIGVKYDGSKWRIFNQDGWNMPVGAAFNVIIPTANVFVHKATAVSGDHTFINNPLTNGHPNAIIFVTPNLTPGGSSAWDEHPIGVYYSGTDSKWAIYNQDVSAMPVNAAFNVFVPTAGAGVFIHTATASNSVSDYTKIDNPLTNGHPNAIVFITRNQEVCSLCALDSHNTGVAYDGSKWVIFNQDTNGVLVNAAFNVLVLVPRSDIFVHTATTGNSVSDFTKIDNPLTNGSQNSNAIIFVTQNFNPGGVGGTMNDHNIAVSYFDGVWAILNQDGASIPVNAAFNVLVPNPDTSVFVHKATAANILSHSTIIDYPLTNGKPNAIFLVTPNWAPGGVCPCVQDNHPIGVFYDGSKWRIFNQDDAAMPVGAAFNVFVPTAGPGVGVFVTRFTGLSWPVVLIDNPLTNSNPNAIILVTPNYNPGGVRGVNADFPIGVRYYSKDKKWGIFSQDGTAMTDTTAFNVYVFANHKLYLPLVLH